MKLKELSKIIIRLIAYTALFTCYILGIYIILQAEGVDRVYLIFNMYNEYLIELVLILLSIPFVIYLYYEQFIKGEILND